MTSADGTVSLSAQPAGAVAVARDEGIDAFRFYAFATVVFLHCLPGATGGWALIDHACRFAVPFFFMASGYFLPVSSPDKPRLLRKIVVRIMPVFVFWAILYTALASHLPMLADPASLARMLVTGGDGWHLWYLPALVVSLALVLVLRPVGWGVLFAIAVGLYAIGLAFGPYRDALNLPALPVNTRNGPFFAVLFIACGCWLRSRPDAPSAMTGLVLALSGLCLQIFEGWGLAGFGSSVLASDVFAGTAVYGAGMFILARHHRQKAWAFLGQRTLGMYCVHLVFVTLTYQLMRTDPAEYLSSVAFVIVSSVIFALAIDQVPVLRRLAR